MQLYVLLLIIFGLSALCLAVATALHRADALAGQRIDPDPRRKLWGQPLYGPVFGNMVLTGTGAFAIAFGFQSQLFSGLATAPWWEVAWKSVAILALYDFGYYAMHRFLFHEWEVLRKVHAFHHRVRHPHAIDSLYMHPVEASLGLILIFVCTWIVGPVDLLTFGVAFAAWSILNILVHLGLDFESRWLAPFSSIAVTHDLHHRSMKAGNYASITSLPDMIFGTHVRPDRQG